MDNVTLTKWLREQQQLERVGGSAYVAELIRDSISTGNVEHHCGLLRESANRRRLLKIAYGLTDTLHHSQMSFNEHMEILRRELEILTPDDSAQFLVEPMALKDKVMALQEKGLPKGERTGWRTMDDYYRVPLGRVDSSDGHSWDGENFVYEPPDSQFDGK